jgi:hypothetical protein
MPSRWTAVLARLGIPTGDGRILAPGGITNRDLPLPLMWQRVTDSGHGGAVTVGVIERINYLPDMVTAEGRFLNVRGAAEAQVLSEEGVVGPSVDIFDDVQIVDEELYQNIMEVQELIDARVVGPNILDNMDDLEYLQDDTGRIVITSGRIAGATLVAIPAFADVAIHTASNSGALVASVRTSGWSDMPMYDESHPWDGDAAAQRVFDWATEGETTDWSRYAQAFLLKRDDEDPETRGAYGFGIADVTEGRLAIVPRGVFAAAAAVQGARGGANISADEASSMRSVLGAIYRRMDRTPPWDEEEMTLTASASVQLPPLEWFQNPMLSGPTPLTVTEDGQVFGHVAVWGTCHVGLPGCVTPPSSPSEYAYFLVGAERTAGGVTVPVGKLTVGGGHADPSAGFVAATQHYDDVGTAVASVFAGEDDYGIWVAGRVIPGTPDDRVAELMRSPLSGDWRRIGGTLELVAAHAVNVPGFPIPRAKVKFSLGSQHTLIGQFSPIRQDPPAITPADDTAQRDAARARWAWSQKGRI